MDKGRGLGRGHKIYVLNKWDFLAEEEEEEDDGIGIRNKNKALSPFGVNANIITHIHLNNVLRFAITSVKPDFSLSYIKEMSLQPARSGTEQSELVLSCTGMML